MATSRQAQVRKKRRGFSLIELLAVIAILGITLTIAISALNSTFKRQRVNSAAEEVKSLAGRALVESQSRNLQTFLVFGKYVDGVGTDVAVVADRPGPSVLGSVPGILDEAYDPNGDGVFDDAAPNVVLRRTRVPEDVFLSKPIEATPVQWAVNTDQIQWRVSPPPTSTTPTFATALLCDSMGRAAVPGATPSMIPGPATIRFTHRDMVAGSLTPFVTYTVSIGPLFKASITRVP